MIAPKVFVSYSHDSDAHKSWVKRFATDLRVRGIDATFDQWDLRVGQDIAMFMQRGIAESDRVVMVCSETYVDKAEAGIGGVGFERLIVTAELVGAIDTIKFVPIMRNCSRYRVPNFLGPRRYIDFCKEDAYETALNELCGDLLGAPTDKPPLGVALSASAPLVSHHRAAGSVGRTPSGKSILDDHWFAHQRSSATAGLSKLSLSGAMELRFGLTEEISKSQLELLEAVREAQIRNFGWPIGVLLENKPEWAPKPVVEGIVAEVALDRNTSPSGRHSYDYWAARSTGDFFLLQSLFEDFRTSKAVFFDTRIVRVAEGLLFAKKFYSRLGAGDDVQLVFRAAHHGVKGRTLASANPNRLVLPTPPCEAPYIEGECVVRLKDIELELPEHVEAILAPLFMLFGFTKLQSAIFEDVVRRFQRGETV